MDIPKWIVIKEVGGKKLDPVNVVLELPVDEILAVMQNDGWAVTRIGYGAELEGKEPLLVLEKQIAWIAVRLHWRLWLFNAGGAVVGNAHIDVLEIFGHVSEHTVGRNYIAGLFALKGYCVEPLELGNKIDNFDGVAVKIYKCGKKI